MEDDQQHKKLTPREASAVRPPEPSERPRPPRLWKRGRPNRRRRGLLALGIILILSAPGIAIVSQLDSSKTDQIEIDFKDLVANYNRWLNADLADFTNQAADDIDNVCRFRSQATITQLESLYMVHRSYQSQITGLYNQLNDKAKARQKATMMKTDQQSLAIDRIHQQTIYDLKHNCPIRAAPETED